MYSAASSVVGRLMQRIICETALSWYVTLSPSASGPERRIAGGEALDFPATNISAGQIGRRRILLRLVYSGKVQVHRSPADVTAKSFVPSMLQHMS